LYCVYTHDRPLPTCIQTLNIQHIQLHSPRNYFTALTSALASTVTCSSKLHYTIFINSSAIAEMADRGVTRTETLHLIEEDLN